ncbi:MAG TPA: SAM-dependent DNA methyltransferase, partial [Arachnia sp.]|nr:SAM-dependent DNA methyltransferase [Arachnia sp.]
MKRFAPSASDHRLWLALVDADGPFLSVPELRRVAPQGFTTLDAPRAAALKAAKAAFESAWDARSTKPDAFAAARDAWVDHVLGTTFGWGQFKQPAPASARVTSPDGQVAVAASFAYVAGGTTRALVLVVPPSASLREAPGDGWSADQVDRLAALLLAGKTPLGVVTDGRWWGLVRAVPGTTVASGIIDSQTWVEEPGPRDAFAGLLSPRHLSQGAADELLEVLFAKSVTAAEEITEALGAQVRQAIELLVASFSETSVAARERGLPDPLPEPDEVYDAAVTVMMRVVFLLFAQERGLLPTGPLFEQSYGLVGQVDALADRAEADTPEALEATALTWYRLLATSKALYEGATFENMRLPAYGGSLFAPDRFEILTATRAD